MKFLISRNILYKKDLSNLEKNFQLQLNEVGKFRMITEKGTFLDRRDGLTIFTDGYIRNFDFEAQDVAFQTENAIQLIREQWPVPDSITGSFACTIIDEIKEEIILCNDSIGIYPLYHLIKDDEFFISNSLIWLGAVSKTEIDQIGLFQRTYCPEFSNIGSRTLLKNAKRLLPGEWIKFNKSGELLAQKFDNELYQNISITMSPFEYWKKFKKEMFYCGAEEESLHIALSGGMDSRLIIGGLPKKKKLICHTYGKDNYYETLIAKRIAELHDAKFRNYSQPEMNFPTKEILDKYTIETEAIYLNNWLEILEAQENKNREIMLLGDMTESLQGRNLPINKNWKNFKQYYLRREAYPFKENSKEVFNHWKGNIIKNYTKLISQTHINRLNIEQTEEQIREGILNDLNDLFMRIEQHNLPYLELVSELFSWFTHARIPMGKQILILNSQFKSYCVPMSIQVLRMTSNLHPNLRLNGRYIKSLFSSVKELIPAGSIPTSQIPYVPFNAPDVLKVPIWFMRSGFDDYLIKRLMKSGNPGKRYRVLKSFNWVEVYQHPHFEKNLRSYFNHAHLGIEYTNGVIEGALARRDLKQWPLSNINIINAAALNAELAIIDSSQSK